VLPITNCPPGRLNHIWRQGAYAWARVAKLAKQFSRAHALRARQCDTLNHLRQSLCKITAQLLHSRAAALQARPADVSGDFGGQYQIALASLFVMLISHDQFAQ
jgi:hypothetical protein